MSLINSIEEYLKNIDPKILSAIEKYLSALPLIEKKIKAIPFIKKQIEKEYDSMMSSMENDLKPYKNKFQTFAKIPDSGLSHTNILKIMTDLQKTEKTKWKNGYVSGAVYHGDEKHINFLNKIYAINSQSNPLHSDLWPSNTKFEAEIVSMASKMLGADVARDKKNNKEEICGTVTSGGTESILLALKSYRDMAKEEKGIKNPEMIIPSTAHAAFDKAAQYFNIKKIKIPVKNDCKANINATKRAISKNTIVIVGSTPSFPHGVIDPIKQLSDLAYKKGIGFHTDACLGGFILPWAKKLGYKIPEFDFSLPGVTSISVDTHKYGYAAKGTSVILYRFKKLRHYQYYTVTDWPGGLYFSPTFAGSRPGALSASCWASMLSMGEKGYLNATKKILETGIYIKEKIKEIPELKILGDPLWVIAFGSDSLNIYRVMDYLTKKNWSLNGLHKPSCIHICLTLRHTQPQVAETFIRDLKSAVKFVKENKFEKGGMAPIYGMAATLPVKSIVGDMLKRYLDLLYKV